MTETPPRRYSRWHVLLVPLAVVCVAGCACWYVVSDVVPAVWKEMTS